MATEIVTLRYPAPRTPDTVRVVVEDGLGPIQTLHAIGREVEQRYGQLRWSHWTWDGSLPGMGLRA